MCGLDFRSVGQGFEQGDRPRALLWFPGANQTPRGIAQYSSQSAFVLEVATLNRVTTTSYIPTWRQVQWMRGISRNCRPHVT